MQKVLVIGNGIAGLSCALLLANQGWEVEIWGKHRLFAPTLILNQITYNLLQEIWQLDPSFWSGWHLLHERKVCWGKKEDVFRLSEPSLVINGLLLRDILEKSLLEKHRHRVQLQKSLVNTDNLSELQGEFAWIVDAGGRKSTIAQQLGDGCRYHFGDRCMLSQEVKLAKSINEDIFWIETVADAWLLLAPLGDKRAILQAMIPNISQNTVHMLVGLLKSSRHLQNYIAEFLTSIVVFPAFPQILQPLSGNKYIAIGDAAFSVDPLSGDGTGYVIRGAILATSIIDAVTSGSGSSDCLKHYNLRLEKAFDAHLQQCLKYYLQGFTSSLWQGEIEKMKKAQELLIHNRNLKLAYGLQDLQLVKLNN